MPVGLTALHYRSCIYVCVSDIKRGSGLVWCGVVQCGVDHQGSEVGKRERVCVWRRKHLDHVFAHACRAITTCLCRSLLRNDVSALAQTDGKSSEMGW